VFEFAANGHLCDGLTIASSITLAITPEVQLRRATSRIQDFRRHCNQMERAMADTRKVQETSLTGGSLEHLRQQLQDWRAGRKLGERIPASLWAAAVGTTG
jgi:hypothetical protein